MRSKEKFRLFLTIPEHPEGSMCEAPVSIVMYWVLKSLSQGRTSLLTQLSECAKECDVDIEDYVSINCLRAYSKVGSQVKAEQIYVHAKLMIVDDRYVLVGWFQLVISVPCPQQTIIRITIPCREQTVVLIYLDTYNGIRFR